MVTLKYWWLKVVDYFWPSEDDEFARFWIDIGGEG